MLATKNLLLLSQTCWKDIPAEIFQRTSQTEFGQGNDLTRNTGGGALQK